MAIYFYKTRDKYGCLSNFSRHGFQLENKWWPTSEHYFQAKKFEGTEFEEAVRQCSTPTKAAALGRDRALPLRSDWENVKNDIMRKAVYEKFTQNEDIKKLLLETGEEILIEKSPIDSYWGCGKNGDSKNMLGVILMEIRGALKKENQTSL